MQGNPPRRQARLLKPTLRVKAAHEAILARVKELEAASNATDIHVFCSLNASVLKSINQKIVRAISEPYLPQAFSGTKILPLFTLMDEIRQAPPNRLTGIISSCFKLIDDAIGELEAVGTYYAKRYFVPLFRTAREIVQSYFDDSDATKPAEVEVAAYPKKYPLQQPGVGAKLKFLVRNKGPGPAPLVDLSFTFGSEVYPAEAKYTFNDLDTSTCEVEIPISVKVPCSSLYYIAHVKWNNFDGSERSHEFDGSLES